MNEIIIHPYFEFNIEDGMLIIRNNLISRRTLQDEFVKKFPNDNVFNYIKFVIFDKNVSEIPGRLFYKNNKVESVYLPETLKVIGVNAFSECNNLKSIYIDSFNFDLSYLDISIKNSQLITMYIKNAESKRLIDEYINANNLTGILTKLDV